MVMKHFIIPVLDHVVNDIETKVGVFSKGTAAWVG
jgi:hypothetical protein